MGAQLIKNVDIGKEQISSGGHQAHWKIYNGVRNDKLQTPLSIFIFEKKLLDSKKFKSHKEEILQFLKKEPQTIQKFRHPKVLSLQEQLIEDNKAMAFATEKVEFSIQSLIEKKKVDDFYSSELELKMHVLDILEALSFFHNDVKISTVSVSPENIYLCPNNQWKIGGLIFSTSLVSNDSNKCENYDIDKNFESFSFTPNLNYTAPEIVQNQNCLYSSDIFSLGMIILSALKSKSDPYSNYEIIQSNNNKGTYLSKINPNFGQFVKEQNYFNQSSEELKQLVLKMINYDPQMRPSLEQIKNSSWLNDPFLKTLQHLEKIQEKDQSQQQAFLQGLNKIILQFEEKVLKTIILPNLIKILKTDQLSAIILQILIKLAENKKFNKQEFQDNFWPTIKGLAQGKEIPAQSLFLLVSNIKLFYEIVPKEEIEKTLIPLVLKCFECKVQKLEELALKNTQFLVKKLEFVYIKSQILPRVLKLCLNPTNIDIRRQSLLCLNKIYHVFDRSTLNDQILVTLEKVRKVGTDSKMNMIILNIYEGITKNIGNECIANKILPQLIPFLIEQNLTKLEFDAYLKTIRVLLQRIEDERQKNFITESPNKETLDLNSLMNEFEEPQNKNQQNQPLSVQQQNADFDFLNMFSDQKQQTQSNLNPELIQSSQQDVTLQQSNQPNKLWTPFGEEFDFVAKLQNEKTTTNVVHKSQIKEQNKIDDDFFNSLQIKKQQQEKNAQIHNQDAQKNSDQPKQKVFQGLKLKKPQTNQSSLTQNQNQKQTGLNFDEDPFAGLGNFQSSQQVQQQSKGNNQPQVKQQNMNIDFNSNFGNLQSNQTNFNQSQKQNNPFENVNFKSKSQETSQQQIQNKKNWVGWDVFDQEIKNEQNQNQNQRSSITNVQKKEQYNDDFFNELNQNNQQKNKNQGLKINKINNPWQNNNDFDLI